MLAMIGSFFAVVAVGTALIFLVFWLAQQRPAPISMPTWKTKLVAEINDRLGYHQIPTVAQLRSLLAEMRQEAEQRHDDETSRFLCELTEQLATHYPNGARRGQPREIIPNCGNLWPTDATPVENTLERILA